MTITTITNNVSYVSYTLLRALHAQCTNEVSPISYILQLKKPRLGGEK